jgi:ribosome maturation factor RimP
LDLKEFVEKALYTPLAVYDARVHEAGKGFHIEVELDNLEDPHGAVNLSDCETYSRRLAELIDHTLEQNGEGRTALPEGITVENYSMEVTSAGAERKLRLPSDLERFRGLPLKVRYRSGETVLSELMVYHLSENAQSGVAYEFEGYKPMRTKHKSGKSKHGRSSTEKERDKRGMIRISADDILDVKLFLDF